MDGVPGELGEMSLVLDERARERLAEGRRLLGVIVSEHGRLRQAAVEEGWRLGSDRPALRAYEQWDPAEHFSALTMEQLRCLLFASAEPELAVFYPRDEQFLVDRDLTVRHYEVYGSSGLAR